MAYISNSNNNTLLVGTAEDDDVYNHDGSSVTINGLAGNDNIGNYGSSVTIDGGVGDDYIASNYGYSVTIDGGNGNDSISTFRGNLITIDGGTGDDDIHNWSDSVTINGGDGNDSIYNGNGSISNSSDEGGSNVSINVGDGDDSITTWGDSVTIEGGTGNNYISNYGSSVTINVSDGNDTITNLGSNVTISGGAGNDVITNSTSYTADETSALVEREHSDNVTINSGTGDDLIVTYSDGFHVYFYTEGDGNDTIFSRSDSLGGNTWATYSDNYSLQINSASPWSSVVSGNNVVITVGDGSITLVDAATSSGVNINGVTYPIDNGGGGTESIPPDPTPTPVTLPPDTPVTPVNPAAPTDVIFIIDKSDSMDTYIQRVKDAITSFANSLGSKSSDFRFGIVEFGQSENGGLPVAKTFTLFNGITPYFTSNVEEFTGTLDTNSDGWAEYGLTAIQTALTMFQADPRLAQKRIVVLTDAGYEGDGTEAEDPSGLTSTDIETALKAANVKMDVVGRMGTDCQTEYEPLANFTGGKFYDIDSLSYYNYFEEIADDILGRAHVNINLDTDSVPEGTTSGVFVVTPTLNAAGATVPASSDATFKAAAEEGDYIVGYVIANKAYTAVPDSPWRQIVTVPDNWIVSGTWQDDAINVTGSNVVISGSLGKDNISINEDVTNTTLVDISELQNGSDTLSFSKRIVPGTLQQNFTGGGVALYTTDDEGALDFVINLPGIAALDESLLNCEVSNAGKPNTIRELIYGEVQQFILNDTLEGRIMFAQWGYGFTPTKDNPLYGATTAATTDTTSAITTETLATSADLAENFGSPTLDEISPANFAVTQDDFTAQNFNALDTNVTQMILASNKFNV